MLSHRLKTIAELTDNPEIIWDIGCDHGHLGMSFINHILVKEIHLVDPSIDVINSLRKSIDSDIPKPKIFLHHMKGQEVVPRNEYRNSVFIAGMGGKEIKEILTHLYSRLSLNDEIIISPHRDILKLREYLSQSAFRLVTEKVVCDGGRFYQMIKLSLIPSLPTVSIYGESLWQGEVGAAYKEYLLSHFQHHRDPLSSDFVRFLRNLVV